MKKIIYTMYALFILSFGLMAQMPPPKEGEMPPPGSGHMGEGHRMRMGEDSLRLFNRAGITLNENQIKQIYDISMKCVSNMQPVELEKRRIEYDIRLELMKDNPSRTLLKDLISKKKAEEAKRDYLQIERDLNIIDVLTPEQKAQLKAYQMQRGRF